jgi:hypothetical protein
MSFKRHTGFRKADETLCADDGAERDGMYITLLPSLACCSGSLLLTLSQTDAIACKASFVHLTEEEIVADVLMASAVEGGSNNELGEP